MLLKISGEALGGPSGYGIDPDVLADFASQVRAVHALGCAEVALIDLRSVRRDPEHDRVDLRLLGVAIDRERPFFFPDDDGVLAVLRPCERGRR